MEVANSIATSTVMSVKCDCLCTLLLPSSDVPSGITDATQHDGYISRSDSVTISQSASSALNQRSSFSGLTSTVRFDSPDELRWVMHAITYGLTMSSENWDVIKHSAHIYCYWIKCLNSSTRSAQSASMSVPIPLILQKEPQRFLKPLLFSLSYYFLPRDPEPLSDQPKLLFATLGRSLSLPPHPTSSDSSEAPSSASANLSGLLSKQLDITRLVAHTIGELCSLPAQLTPDSWDCILRFCLIICHAILSQPLHLPSGLSQSSTSTSQLKDVSNSGSGSAGGSSSMTFLTNHPSFSDIKAIKDSAILFDATSDCVSTLLFSTWLKACSHCFPKPQLWAAFRECARVWRHHNAFIRQWSRVSVALSATLLGILDKSTDLNAYASLTQLIPSDLSDENAKEAWIRMLYLIDNPVDLSHDSLICNTPIFEEYKKYNYNDRVRWTAIYFPYIYHQALRGLSMIVDGFLGIQPSLTVGVDPFIGVIPELYGPIGKIFYSYPSYNLFQKHTDIQGFNNDDEVKKALTSGFSGIHGGSRLVTGSFSTEKTHRKSRLASVVTSAGILASAGTSGSSKSVFAPPSSTSTHPHTSNSLTPIEITASLTNTFQQSQTPSSHVSLQLSNASSSGQSISQKLGSSPPLLSLNNKNPQIEHLQSLATTWLSVDSQITLNPQRPEINSLLQLFGVWLFEASVSGVKQDLNVTVISNRATLIDGNRFQVGRAEALGTLCRIMIYARRGRLAKEYLTRFYLCLYYALAIDPTAKNDYILCLVLFYSMDLFRVDLPGINILLPRIYDACQHVLKEEINMKPEFLPTTLVQRAAIHQLMSMVCIPVQFKGAFLKPLIPLASNAKDPRSLNDVKSAMVDIICDTLSSTDDPINFQLLLSVALALIEDMSTDEMQLPSGRNDSSKSHTSSSFFNILTPLLCGNLVYKWKNDSSVMLYLLEIISCLSNVHVTPADPATYRHTVRSICEFIANQCNRERKDHKRQLHSIIVAAYYCLSSWIVQHTNLLLTDGECVWTILETIELGICGAKSANKQTKSEPSSTVPKGQKPLIPSSRRVCDAAEACLSNLMSVAGSFPGPSGTSTICSQLAEDNILKLIVDEEFDSSRDLPEFRYFWSEPGLLIGLCEFSMNSFKPTIKFQNECSVPGPAAILIVRGPFGRHVWIMHMRHSPLSENDPASQSTSCYKQEVINRPKPWGCFLERLITTVTNNENIHPLNFPPSLSDIPLVEADHTIPSLDKVGFELGSSFRQEINAFKTLIAEHSSLAKEVGLRCAQEIISKPCPDPITEAKAPVPVVNFHPIRLLLTHLGYLSIGPYQMPQSLWSRPELKRDNQSGERSGQAQRQSPSLTSNRITQGFSFISSSNSTEDELLPLFPFDVKNPDFTDILTNLDHMPTRTGDTLLVFYVAAGQWKVDEILANMKIWPRLPELFHQFLSGIGCLKNILDHPGWTGNIQTSYRTSNGYLVSSQCNQTNNILVDHCPDGIQSIIYYADAMTELACICPTDTSYKNEKNESNRSLKSTCSRTASEIISGITRGINQSVVGMGEVGADPTGGRVAVVWLEQWEDGPMHCGPGIGINIQNMTSQKFDCPVTIYIHPLSSGLCRIGIMRLQGRTFEAGPLQSGLVLSQRCLSSFVRQTVINLSRRRRLASDSFQPPHVRRSHELFKLAEVNRKIVRAQSLPGNKINAYSCTTSNIVRSLFFRQLQIHST
ncbi:Ral GTPase-activating protein subunit beta [Schistosoma japonicum]|nr:Ral GTPase-activating protein subunit beta [Schistosoma japonicum]KAH8860571.1 Ral GTPase-activating protein subunit beta [Schistosoma japonicum]